MLDLSPFSNSKTYEIIVHIKDAQGNPTQKKKRYASDDVYKIWKFWMRHRGIKKRKRSRIPTAQEAEKTLKEMYQKSND